MWIVEGLGEKMATNWAKRVEELTGLDETCTRFLRYHGRNDQSHMDRFFGLLDRVTTETRAADAIVLTAAVVRRPYALQLEEIDKEQ